MIPAEFDYEVAESVEQAVALLGANEDAKLLAGGQSLLPLLKLRMGAPSLLVDLGRIPALTGVREDGGTLVIGALTTHQDVHLDATVRRLCPFLAHVAGEVGDPQVRHLGTIGGSIAHADPAGDLPAAALALEAELVIQGPDGRRTVPATEFFVGPFTTALGPQDVLTAIRVKAAPDARWAYEKFRPRAQDWAIVGVAAVADGGTTRVALVNMGATPLRAAAVEAALAVGASAAEAAERAADGAEPVDDATASAEYRRHLARVLVRRALEAVGA